jgi:DNA-binding NarL/FixJ family response regulator
MHIQNILAKLDASDRTHAVTIALERGILHLDF